MLSSIDIFRIKNFKINYNYRKKTTLAMLNFIKKINSFQNI